MVCTLSAVEARRAIESSLLRHEAVAHWRRSACGPYAARSWGGTVRGASGGARITVWGGGGAADGVAAAVVTVGGIADGGETGADAGRSGDNGVPAITAGTGSNGTRGGGSGISSGTVMDARAGLDATTSRGDRDDRPAHVLMRKRQPHPSVNSKQAAEVVPVPPL